MTDKEKVIKGLKRCISIDDCNPETCPYYKPMPGLCFNRLAADALELIEKQQDLIDGTRTFAPEGEFKMEEKEYVPDVSRRAVIFALRKHMQNMDLTNPIYTTLRDALFLLERDGKLLLEYDQKLRDFEKRFM